MSSISLANVIFHNNITTVQDGSVYIVPSNSSVMNIDFVERGVNSTFVAIIEGKVVAESNWSTIRVWNLAEATGTKNPNTFGAFQCDLSGWSEVRCRITSLTGTISVYGKIVGE